MVDDPSEHVDVLLSDPKARRAAQRELNKRLAAHAARRVVADDEAIDDAEPVLEEVIADASATAVMRSRKEKRPLRGVGPAMLSPAGSRDVTVNPYKPEFNGKGWAECSG